MAIYIFLLPLSLYFVSSCLDQHQIALNSLNYNSLSQIEAVEQRSTMAQQHKLSWEEDVEKYTAPKFVTLPKSLDNLVEGQNAHFEAKPGHMIHLLE